MNKKNRIIVCLIIILVFGLLCSQVKAENSFDSSVSEKWGDYLGEIFKSKSKNRSNLQNDIYAEGNDITISIEEMEQTTFFFKLQGNSGTDAEELAYEYMKESAALYSEALKKGYTVTDEEVMEHVEELKATVEDDSLDEASRSQIESVMSGFGSEEDYWEYQKQVYQKLLVSQKYVDELQRDFYNDSSVSQEEWNDYFEELKRTLVQKENFQIVGEL